MTLSAVTTLQLVDRNLTQTQAATAADPTVKRETSYFLANIGNIKTSSDFVNNYQLFSYAMTAFGLSDMTYAKAFMQKVMDGGVSNTKSLANQLTDPRFKAFAEAFDFGDKGAATTSDSAANQTVTSNFVEQTLENNVGQDNAGAQIALYFQRQAPNVKSGLDILADKALTQFVQTACNINLSGGTDIDTEATEIERKINMADLQDPTKVAKMVSRFASLWDLQNSDPTANNPALDVLSGSSSSSTIDTNLLTSLQSVNMQSLYSQF